MVLATASEWVIPGNVMASAIQNNRNGVKTRMVRQVDPMMCVAEGDRVVSMNESSSVVLLPPESIKPFTHGLIKEDPIDVVNDSDDEELTCDEKIDEKGSEKDYEVFSVDGMEMVAKTSDFDADALFVDAMANNDTESLNKKKQETTSVKEGKGWSQCEVVMSGSDDKTKAELDVNLHLTTTESLRKAKRRMERSFIDDYN